MNPEPLRKPVRHSPLALRIVLFTLAGISALVILIVLVGALAFTIANRTNGKIISSGETRRYLLHVPKNIDPSQPVPLVITFHGFAAMAQQPGEREPVEPDRGSGRVYRRLSLRH